jgi:nitrile hydratase accessory protein
MTTLVAFSELPGLPQDGAGPVFAAPWQAHAFALTVSLHERGLFAWREWAEALGSEIAAAKARGDPDDGSTYYEHWLAALERMLVVKGVTTYASLTEMADEWIRAAIATPHGQPIERSRR